MSGLLYVVGAFATVLGVVAAGFGVPISEFSFGNTLIVAGTTLAVGGLIVFSLGIVVAQLRYLADALANRAPVRAGRPVDTFDTPRAAPAPSRVAKPKNAITREPPQHEALEGPSIPSEMSSEENQSFAPTLHNPDGQAATVEDEVSLSPPHPIATSAAASTGLGEKAPRGFNGSAMPEPRHEPSPDTDWRPMPSPAAPAQPRQPHTAYFDAMWPAEPKVAKSSDVGEEKAEPMPDLHDVPPAPFRGAVAPEAPIPRAESETRTVSILKSGVVDGMGYTLYVDGSIEAELPQGTLRFASINELRSHLENNA